MTLCCVAHDNTTIHPAISKSAAQSSAVLKDFLADFFEISPDAALFQPKLTLDPGTFGATEHSPIEWIAEGSFREDGISFWETAKRTRNHFYDPTKQPPIGLTDGLDFGGIPSFMWASAPWGGALTPPTANINTWRDARACEFNALTNSNYGERQKQLAQTLLDLGYVIHLNQDLTVPMHVRNDNHIPYPKASPIYGPNFTETYGQEVYSKEPIDQAFPQRPHGWTWWQNTAGFQKLEDFWNRDFLRIRDAAALDDDANNVDGKQLGLAEFCNGNFICEDASYREYHNPGEKHYFQYPSRDHGTTYKPAWQIPLTAIDNSFLKDGSPIQRVYLGKTAQGVHVTHHSVLGYLDVMAMASSQDIHIQRKLYTPSIDDTNVLQDYHSILIPKTVEYSAGILDYFFRGTMEVSIPGYDTNAPTFTNVVRNTSGQDFHGGNFYVFADATNGTRTEILRTNLSDINTDPNGSFTNGNSLELICPGPLSFTNKYLVVYQGTIGWTNGAALDLVDSNICVAATRAWIKQVKTYSNQISIPDPYPDDPVTITTNLESDDFDFTPTAGHYEVFINFARFDDTGTLGGVQPTGGPSSCTLINEIRDTIVPAEEVTIIGNHLRVPVTATDDPLCKTKVGWWEITLTWKAWPAP